MKEHPEENSFAGGFVVALDQRGDSRSALRVAQHSWRCVRLRQFLTGQALKLKTTGVCCRCTDATLGWGGRELSPPIGIVGVRAARNTLSSSVASTIALSGWVM